MKRDAVVDPNVALSQTRIEDLLHKGRVGVTSVSLTRLCIVESFGGRPVGFRAALTTAREMILLQPATNRVIVSHHVHRQ